MSRWIRRLLVVTFVAAVHISVARGAAYQGIITHVYPSNGMVYVLVANGAFDGSQGNCPSPGNAMLFSLDPATAFGRALLSVALSAEVSGKTVWAAGDSVCTGGSPYGTSSEGLVGMDLKGQ